MSKVRAESNTKSSKRKVGRPFAKGQSGNPGGRKPIPDDVKAIWRDNTATLAAKLVEVALNDKHPDQVKALGLALERCLGKVPVRLADHEGNAFGMVNPKGLNEEELLGRAAAILAAHTAKKTAPRAS